jgi:antirestriction protein
MTYTTENPAVPTLDTPHIYVACLSSYNSGRLHGRWIDAKQDSDEIREEIQQMLCTSPVADLEACEDFAIHDYQGFLGISLNEHENIDRVSALANAIEEHGQPFALYLDYLGFVDIAKAVRAFEDNYSGCFKSAQDYAQDYYEQTGQLATIQQLGLISYINWDAISNDWQYSGDILCLEQSSDQIHVFYNH